MIINTKLTEKKQIFDALAIGYLTQMPILLQGPPGIGKTQVALDFAASINAKVFVNQLSFGTRPSEIKGVINIPKLTKDGIQETISPIADAEVIIIDEIEKGSSEIRNTLLSILREREIFLGAEENKKCKWKLFVGTVNEIPEDEMLNPFWDRFIIKTEVTRINPKSYPMMWDPKEVSYTYPDSLVDLKVDCTPLLEHLVKSLTDKLPPNTLTDRTISYIPKLFRAVHSLYQIDIIDSCVKTGALLSNCPFADLINTIAPKEYAVIRSTINNIHALENVKDVKAQRKALFNTLTKHYLTAGKLIKSIFEAEYEMLKNNESPIEELQTNAQIIQAEISDLEFAEELTDSPTN